MFRKRLLKVWPLKTAIVCYSIYANIKKLLLHIVLYQLDAIYFGIFDYIFNDFCFTLILCHDSMLKGCLDARAENLMEINVKSLEFLQIAMQLGCASLSVEGACHQMMLVLNIYRYVYMSWITF